MRLLRLVAVYLKITILNEAQYPVNFFFGLFQSIVALGTGLVVLTLVFSRVPELNGWSKPELLVLLGVFTALGGVVRTVIKPNIQQFFNDVNRGQLDYLFTKPADAQLLVSIRALQLWQAVDIVTGTVLVGVGLAGLPGGVQLADVAVFIASLGLATTLVYSLLMILATTAFWFVRSYQILELFDGIWQAGRWPVGLYPPWLRTGLTVIVPVGISVTVPAEAITSRLTVPTLLGTAVLSAVLFLAARAYWRLGVRSYTGASS